MAAATDPEARTARLHALRRAAVADVARRKFPHIARALKAGPVGKVSAPQDFPHDLAAFLENRTVRHPMARRAFPREHSIIRTLLQDVPEPHHTEWMRMVLDAVREAHEVAGVGCPEWVMTPVDPPLPPAPRTRRRKNDAGKKDG